MTARLAASGAIFAMVGACADVPSEPDVAFLSGPDASVSPSSARVIASVTGNSHLPVGANMATRDYNIVLRADGGVAGFYHALARGPGGAHLRVRMDCLHVVGNQAWATGTVVSAVGAANIGRPYSFRFIDNGEGRTAPPDEVGIARFQYYDCTTEPDIPLRQLTVGNIQVRG